MNRSKRIPRPTVPAAELADAANKAYRSSKKRIAKTTAVIAALAIAAGTGFATYGFTKLHTKPTNVYSSQSPFVQLQRYTEKIKAESHDMYISQYFEVAMIKGNVPLGEMRLTAHSVQKAYKNEVSVSSSETSAEKAINSAAGININTAPAGFAIEELYGGPLGLSNLKASAKSLQAQTNAKIADFYYVEMIYYNRSDTAGFIANFAYNLAAENNFLHKGVSTKKEVSRNTAMAKRAIYNLVLVNYSDESAYAYSLSSKSMYDATQAAVNNVGDDSKIYSSLAAAAILFAEWRASKRWRRRKNKRTN